MKRLLTIAAIVLMSAIWAIPLNAQPAFSVGSTGQDQSAKAITAGKLTVKPTILCVGLQWLVQGDSNLNASAELSFRQVGQAQWKPAMPLWRMWPQKIDRANNTIGGFKVADRSLLRQKSPYAKGIIAGYAQNYFAGSIFNLKPGTKYEVKIDLKDSDGGSLTKTLTVATRKVPVLPTKGNIIHVRGGDNALRDALVKAKAGDIFLVHAGRYNARNLITASGTPDNPIVVRSAGDGEVVITGEKLFKRKNPRKWTWADDQERGTDAFTVLGNYVYFHDLTIRDVVIAFYFGGRPTGDLNKKSIGVSVTRCKMMLNFNGLFGKASDSYFADNIICGDWHGGSEGDGYTVHGSGNVLCYNDISHTANGISPEHTSECDFYNNKVYYHGTDLVEFDGGGPNIRVWDNQMAVTDANGLSVQPYIGGPVYIIRNQISQVYENIMKVRQKASGMVLINNTFYAPRFTNLPEHVYARNNLFLSDRARHPSPKGNNAVLGIHTEDLQRNPRTADFDYNGYNGPICVFFGAPYMELPRVKDSAVMSTKAFCRKDGMECHGTMLKYNQLFNKPKPMTAEQKRQRNNWEGDPCDDFHLRRGAPAIDKGVMVTNIIETFNGKAPDLGAIEYGTKPIWGPRPIIQDRFSTTVR